MKLHITVVWSDADRQCHERVCLLNPGSCLADALLAVGWGPETIGSLDVGVWGRKTSLRHVLREQDRVECYRPLTVDPKVARKERFGRQGVRAAGLFAQRRPGSKPGY